MNTPLFQALNESRTRLSSPSDHRGGDNASKASRPPPPGLVDLRMEPTDDDSDLIVLGKQFEETITKIRGLYEPASPDDHLKPIEAMLVSLEPIEQAIYGLAQGPAEGSWLRQGQESIGCGEAQPPIPTFASDSAS
jgi:hypothetical protein